MTAALILCCLFLLIAGTIPAQFAYDNATCRTERELAAWEQAFAEARDSLLPEDFFQAWPQRQTPSDMPARRGVVVAEDRPGRHRPPEPPRDELTNTGQFWLIVDGFTDLTQPCSHCAAPEDGEPAHVGCPGCACPCSMAEVAS